MLKNHADKILKLNKK